MPKPTAVLFLAVPPAGAAKGRYFSKLDGREVFMRTIELYANRDHITQHILVVPPDDLANVQSRYGAHLGFQGVSVAAGGPAWMAAIAAGLQKVKPEAAAVIIHDAARPAVPYMVLDALDEAIDTAPAAVPVLKVTGSFAQVTDGTLGDPIQTPALHDIQTPQIFLPDVLQAAVALNDGPDDLLQRVRSLGHTVVTVAGSPYNVRVDSVEMVKLGGDCLKHLSRPRAKGPANPFEEAQW